MAQFTLQEISNVIDSSEELNEDEGIRSFVHVVHTEADYANVTDALIERGFDPQTDDSLEIDGTHVGRVFAKWGEYPGIFGQFVIVSYIPNDDFE